MQRKKPPWVCDYNINWQVEIWHCWTEECTCLSLSVADVLISASYIFSVRSSTWNVPCGTVVFLAPVFFCHIIETKYMESNIPDTHSNLWRAMVVNQFKWHCLAVKDRQTLPIFIASYLLPIFNPFATELELLARIKWCDVIRHQCSTVYSNISIIKLTLS